LILIICDLERFLEAVLYRLVEVRRVLDTCQNVFKLAFDFEVEILRAVLGAPHATMPVENCVIGYLDLVVQIK
jgi:hypothetical protein